MRRKALMDNCRRIVTRLTLLGRVMVSGEFIQSSHVPTKAYPQSNAEFMARGLMKPPGAAIEWTSSLITSLSCCLLKCETRPLKSAEENVLHLQWLGQALVPVRMRVQIEAGQLS